MGMLFEYIRGGVTAREAAEMYGLEFNGMRARCPWNAAETRFNLSFERNGRCHCFACGAGGDAIDLTAQLFGLSLLDAAKKLNADFRLGVDEAGTPSPEMIARQRERERIKQERAAQLAEQQRVYESVQITIQQLADAVKEDRPAEEFDFGGAKFTNALKLIEVGGKNLPPEAQAMLVQEFRYCPDALKTLKPIMAVAGMLDGVKAIEDLQIRSTDDSRYINALDDAFWFACRRPELASADLYNAVSRADAFVSGSDTFNRSPGKAAPQSVEDAEAEAKRLSDYERQLKANAIRAEAEAKKVENLPRSF